MKILVIYADIENTGTIADTLKAGWPDAQVLEASPSKAIGILKKYSPDMVALDLGDSDYLSILKSVRNISTVPLVVAGEPNGESSVIKVLGCGADCYIKKSVGQAEFLARFRAVYRRSFPGSSTDILRQGGLALNKASNRLNINGDEIHLTNNEKKLLETLINNRGKFISSRQLAIQIYGSLPGEESIKTYIYRLRKKLKGSTHYPDLIQSNPGNGYSLSAV